MKKVLVILGPTASGKTQLAVNIAHKFNGEMLSGADRQPARFQSISCNIKVSGGYCRSDLGRKSVSF